MTSKNEALDIINNNPDDDDILIALLKRCGQILTEQILDYFVDKTEFPCDVKIANLYLKLLGIAEKIYPGIENNV